MFLFQRYRVRVYFQDDWRLTNRLTLNLGLRYEYTSPYGEKWGNIGYIDANGIEPITGGKGRLQVGSARRLSHRSELQDLRPACRARLSR